MKTKGKKIDNIFLVKRSGTSIVGCMSWETPYIEFDDGTINGMRWQSDSIGNGIYHIKRGDVVRVQGFLYGSQLRRVTVTKMINIGNSITVGMQRK